jgi:hypothetical protein
MGQFRDVGRVGRGAVQLLVKPVRRDFYILIRGHNNVYKTINIRTHRSYARVCVRSYLRQIKPPVARRPAHNDLCGFILIFPVSSLSVCSRTTTFSVLPRALTKQYNVSQSANGFYSRRKTVYVVGRRLRREKPGERRRRSGDGL